MFSVNAEKFTLTLEENHPGWFIVSCGVFPDFFTEVTGYEFEAKERARRVFREWLARQAEIGREMPAPDSGGYLVYSGGAKKSNTDEFWNKKDVQRALGLSKSTVDRRVADGTFRKYRCGGRVVFNPSQIRMAVFRTTNILRGI